jgi:hypothetical protein
VKPIRFPVLVFVWVFLGLSSHASHAESWQVHTSDHFQVFFAEDSAYATQVSQTAESLYHRLQAELGFDRAVKKHQVFWLWDDRCRIYIYRSHAEYLAATGAPRWSGGFVRYRERTVYSFQQAETFLESILPHEMAHLMFRELVGYDNPRVPQGVDEGVAQFAEMLDRDLESDPMAERVAGGNYLSLDQLRDLQPQWLDNETARLFYAEAASSTRYLVEHMKAAEFQTFMEELRKGNTAGSALGTALLRAGDLLAAMEANWVVLLKEKADHYAKNPFDTTEVKPKPKPAPKPPPVKPDPKTDPKKDPKPPDDTSKEPYDPQKTEKKPADDDDKDVIEEYKDPQDAGK